MSALTVGVVRETAAGVSGGSHSPPTRWPDSRPSAWRWPLNPGAGASAWFPDAAYADAGATIGSTTASLRDAAVVLVVRAPAGADADAAANRGRSSSACSQLLSDHGAGPRPRGAQVTAISLDGLPRTLSRAQAMDVLTSQANVAGYKSALVAAGRLRPLLPDADDRRRHRRARHELLVLGAGVAGLQAIGTARRLGAVVTGYDVRDADRRRGARRLGARSWTSPRGRPAAGGAGGYARELDRVEQARPAGRHGHSVVTASTSSSPLPRCRAATRPYWSRADAVAGMRAGLGGRRPGRSPLGGNVEGSRRPDATVVTDNGVTAHRGRQPAVDDAHARPRRPTPATSRHCCCHLLVDGQLVLDLDDEITRRSARHPRRRGRPPGGRRASRPPSPQGRYAMSPALFADITIFVLSLLVGFEVITQGARPPCTRR